ncbi:hypothetical protein ACTMU2_17155 [Cupriavidus basilensis]
MPFGNLVEQIVIRDFDSQPAVADCRENVIGSVLYRTGISHVIRQPGPGQKE